MYGTYASKQKIKGFGKDVWVQGYRGATGVGGFPDLSQVACVLIQNPYTPIPQYGSVNVVSLSISEEPRLGGESPKPPIGRRLRPPNPLQKIVLFYV